MKKTLLTLLAATTFAGGMSFTVQAQNGEQNQDRERDGLEGVVFLDNRRLFTGELLNFNDDPFFNGEGLGLFDGEGSAMFEGGMLSFLDRDGETLFNGDFEEFLREAGSRSADRLDELGADLDRRYNEAAARASENGMENFAMLLDKTGDAFQESYERRSDRIQERSDRRAERRNR